MNILNFGSLNIDYVYRVDTFLEAGETKLSKDLNLFCGGKGLNQSIAMARAGNTVYHAGLLGEDGQMLKDKLMENGVKLDYLKPVNGKSGHAIIQVADSGQNCIDEYCSDFNMRMAERAFSHAHDGAAMSAEQRSAVRYHNYGVMGMFRDWLFGRGPLTSAEMSSFLFERTPDFLKEAYGSYPYSMDETLSQTGKDTRRIKETGLHGSGPRR